MISGTINNIFFEYPNPICFCHSNPDIYISGLEPYGIVRVNMAANNRNLPTITRNADSNGKCHIPLEGVFSSLFTAQRSEEPFSDGFRYCQSININVYWGEPGGIDIGKLIIINGSGDEVKGKFIYPGATEYFYPNPKKIIYYPNIPDGTQYFSLITGTTDDMAVYPCLTNEINEKLRSLVVFNDGYTISRISYKNIPQGSIWGYIGATHFNTLRELTISDEPILEIDYCDDGLFTRWFDSNGIIRYYRWSIEEASDTSDINSTYTMLDSSLRPYESVCHSIRRKYVLHSRLVDRLTTSICRSILDGRDIQYYDAERREWVDCIIGELNEVKDTGRALQDMIIDVVSKRPAI